jgi:hypothetical protein
MDVAETNVVKVGSSANTLVVGRTVVLAAAAAGLRRTMIAVAGLLRMVVAIRILVPEVDNVLERTKATLNRAELASSPQKMQLHQLCSPLKHCRCFQCCYY